MSGWRDRSDEWNRVLNRRFFGGIGVPQPHSSSVLSLPSSGPGAPQSPLPLSCHSLCQTLGLPSHPFLSPATPFLSPGATKSPLPLSRHSLCQTLGLPSHPFLSPVTPFLSPWGYPVTPSSILSLPSSTRGATQSPLPSVPSLPFSAPGATQSPLPQSCHSLSQPVGLPMQSPLLLFRHSLCQTLGPPSHPVLSFVTPFLSPWGYPVTPSFSPITPFLSLKTCFYKHKISIYDSIRRLSSDPSSHFDRQGLLRFETSSLVGSIFHPEGQGLLQFDMSSLVGSIFSFRWTRSVFLLLSV